MHLMAESNITDSDLEEQTTKQTYILDSMHTETLVNLHHLKVPFYFI